MIANPGDVLLLIMSGGTFLVGLVSDDGQSLVYPAQIIFAVVPTQGAIQGQTGFATQALVAPIPAPVFPIPPGVAWTVLNADEMGQSFGAGQAFLKNYRAYVDQQKAPASPRRIVHG